MKKDAAARALPSSAAEAEAEARTTAWQKLTAAKVEPTTAGSPSSSGVAKRVLSSRRCGIAVMIVVVAVVVVGALE